MLTQLFEPPPTGKSELPESDRLYEEVDGQLVEAPPMRPYASLFIGRLLCAINNYAEAHDLGFAVVEALFRFPPAMRRSRRPDLAFVSWNRWPKGQRMSRTDDFLEAVPDLMVEVISPTNLAEEMMAKVAEYFTAGAQHVWLVYPTQSRIQIFESLTSSRWVTRGDVLDNLPYLPGFELPLTKLFTE